MRRGPALLVLLVLGLLIPAGRLEAANLPQLMIVSLALSWLPGHRPLQRAACGGEDGHVDAELGDDDREAGSWDSRLRLTLLTRPGLGPHPLRPWRGASQWDIVGVPQHRP